MERSYLDQIMDHCGITDRATRDWISGLAARAGIQENHQELKTAILYARMSEHQNRHFEPVRNRLNLQLPAKIPFRRYAGRQALDDFYAAFSCSQKEVNLIEEILHDLQIQENDPEIISAILFAKIYINEETRWSEIENRIVELKSIADNHSDRPVLAKPDHKPDRKDRKHQEETDIHRINLGEEWRALLNDLPEFNIDLKMFFRTLALGLSAMTIMSWALPVFPVYPATYLFLSSIVILMIFAFDFSGRLNEFTYSFFGRLVSGLIGVTTAIGTFISGNHDGWWPLYHFWP